MLLHKTDDLFTRSHHLTSQDFVTCYEVGEVNAGCAGTEGLGS